MTDRPKKQPVKHGRAASSHDDDRPRGFQPQRMRRLWQDIDRARDGLGLSSSKEPQGAESWTMTGLLGRVADLANGVLRWVGAESLGEETCQDVERGSSKGTRSDEPTGDESMACALVERGVSILRQVPILGRFVSLVSPG